MTGAATPDETEQGTDARTAEQAGVTGVRPHMHPGDAMSRRRRLATIVVLGLLTGLGPFTIDTYLPAFPVIKDEFGATDAAVQLTLSATTLGFALGQLLVGPLSDRLGRRLPLALATTVHVIASVGVALAPDLTTLGLLRVLQGIGAAGGAVVAMAMVRDLFGGKPLVRMLSRLALIMGLAPIVAPIFGSWMLGFTDWRGIFWVLACYGILVILCQVAFLRETLPVERRTQKGHSTLGQRYRAVLTDRFFIGVAIIGSSAFGGMFAYLSTSSLLLQDVYGLTPGEYAGIFAICSLGVLIGTQTSSRLATRFGPQWVLAYSTAMLVVGALLVIGSDLAGLGIMGLIPSLFVYTLSFGFSMPCVQAIGLAHHGKEAGTAASLLGASNMVLAGLVSPIVGLFAIENAIPMGVVMLACGIIATASLWLIVRPRQVPALEE